MTESKERWRSDQRLFDRGSPARTRHKSNWRSERRAGSSFAPGIHQCNFFTAARSGQAVQCESHLGDVSGVESKSIRRSSSLRMQSLHM